jgi:epoxyqueuosine reductase
MRLLLHVCCGPCTFFPVSVLRQEGISFSSYFFNPNIHPFKEFRRRINALSLVADHLDFDLIIDNNYGLTEFLRKVVFNEMKRCHLCYDIRLEKTVEFASEHCFDSFSTTLLYSKYQNHALIVEKCFRLAEKFGIEFFYRDFRQGWQYGIDESKALDIYRQPYCGCIYSEQESFDKKFHKKKNLTNTVI